MIHARTLLPGLAMLAAAPAIAQQPAPGIERVGYIVAVVGDSVLLNFDIQEGLFARAAERRLQAPPAAGPELDSWKQEILDERINELMILQAALRDTTLHLNEEQITRTVQQDVEQRQQQAGGAVAFESALRSAGLTPSEYRERLMQQARRSARIQMYISKIRQQRKAPPVSEAELREYFDITRERWPERPPSVSFQQVIVRTQPSDSARGRAKIRADSIYHLALGKEEFAELARRFGEDATRERGGDLGFFRRNTMIRDFENVAFQMPPGMISPPVLTQYGYHIIKVERVRGPEIQARHILIRPELTDADALRARARADTVAERLRAGEDANQLAQQYGDRDEQVRVPVQEIAAVQQQYGVDLSNSDVGDVVGPIPVGGEDVAERFVVLKILERQAARAYSFDDPELRERLRQDLEFQKLFEEVVEELRRSTYVDVRGT